MKNRYFLASIVCLIVSFSLFAEQTNPFLVTLIKTPELRNSYKEAGKLISQKVRVEAIKNLKDISQEDLDKLKLMFTDSSARGEIDALSNAINTTLKTETLTDDERFSLRMSQLQLIGGGFVSADDELLDEIRSDMKRDKNRPILKSFLANNEIGLKISLEDITLEKAGVLTVQAALALGERLFFLLEAQSDVPLWIPRFLKAFEFDFAEKFLAKAKEKNIVSDADFAKFTESIKLAREKFAQKDKEEKAALLRAAQIVKGYTFKEVYIPQGSFTMGSSDGNQDEKPAHKVNVSAIYANAYEITFEQYDAYCLDTGVPKPQDAGKGRQERALVNVSFIDAVKFCNWASVKKGLTPVYTISGANVVLNKKASGYRLPTEAEWEYMAGGASKREGFQFAGGSDSNSVAWNTKNSEGSSKSVGTKVPNSLGLYDMSGNVWEWCSDFYDMNYYASSPAQDPYGPDTGAMRVVRGGSWNNKASSLRILGRGYQKQEERYDALGFRVVRNAK